MFDAETSRREPFKQGFLPFPFVYLALSHSTSLPVSFFRFCERIFLAVDQVSFVIVIVKSAISCESPVEALMTAF